MYTATCLMNSIHNAVFVYTLFCLCLVFNETLLLIFQYMFGLYDKVCAKEEHSTRCFLEQDTYLSSLLSTGWFQERIRA